MIEGIRVLSDAIGSSGVHAVREPRRMAMSDAFGAGKSMRHDLAVMTEIHGLWAGPSSFSKMMISGTRLSKTISDVLRRLA